MLTMPQLEESSPTTVKAVHMHSSLLPLTVPLFGSIHQKCIIIKVRSLA